MSKQTIQMTDAQGNELFPMPAGSGNGWIRFADGTQICYGERSVNTSPTIISFAKSFVDSPVVICKSFYNSDVGFCGVKDGINTPSNDGFAYYYYENVPRFLKLSYIAIGRWK